MVSKYALQIQLATLHVGARRRRMEQTRGPMGKSREVGFVKVELA